MKLDRQLLRENLSRARFRLLEAQDEVTESLRKLWPSGFRAQVCHRWNYEISGDPVTIVGVIDTQFVLVEDGKGNRRTVHPDDLSDESMDSF